jgi:hypothetical protein
MFWSSTVTTLTSAGVNTFMMSPLSILRPSSVRMPRFAHSAPAPLSSATFTTGSAAIAASWYGCSTAVVLQASCLALDVLILLFDIAAALLLQLLLL